MNRHPRTKSPHQRQTSGQYPCVHGPHPLMISLLLNSTLCDGKSSSCYRVHPCSLDDKALIIKCCDVIMTPKYLNHKTKRNQVKTKPPATPPLNLRLLLPTIRMQRLSSAAAPCCRGMGYISQSRRVQWAVSDG